MVVTEAGITNKGDENEKPLEGGIGEAGSSTSQAMLHEFLGHEELWML